MPANCLSRPEVPLNLHATLSDKTSAAEDPILQLYRRWLAHRKEWSRLSQLPDGQNSDTPEMIAAQTAELALVDDMGRIAPSSPEGLAALMHVLWDEVVNIGFGGPATFDAEFDHPAAQIIHSVWRSTGQASPAGVRAFTSGRTQG